MSGTFYHARYPVELGVPEVLAHLEDRLFERLPLGEAQLWPERFLDAIQPGADLSLVWPRFALWLLTEELARWRTPASDAVADLYRMWIATGERPASEAWQEARADAAASAADAAASAALTIALDWASESEEHDALLLLSALMRLLADEEEVR